MEFILGGAAASLFTYNRANFMFDKTQQQERLFTGQEMLVKQFELYREDVRDLMELTVAKMDNYLVINVILLTSAVLLMSEGRPEPEMSPEWLHWLYAITNAGAMLYILLSVWLGMHASIAAHSFGVRMLTQYVRLPIPTKEQMDIGRARANQYEEQEVGDMFRIPVLKLQAKRLNAVMNNDTNQEDDESESGDAPTSRREQAATVEHIQRFRELQANWQAYDAYTRVCMAMGTNQLLQATSYYCLTMLICENHTPSRAAVVVVMAMSAWLIIRLDVCISRKLLALAALLLFFGPTAAMACLLLDPQYTDYDVPDVWKSLGDYMVPLVFLTQLAWVGFVVYLAWGKNADGVVLPIKFRAVLYLDVFGRLSQTPESAAQGRARDRLERMASRGSAWQEPSGSPRSPPPGAASDGPEGSWGSARSGDAAAPAARRAHLQGLAAHCRRRLAAVSDDLGKWEGDAVAACLTEDDTTVLDDVASLRTLLESISGDIQQATPAGTPMDTPLSEGARLENERRQVPRAECSSSRARGRAGARGRAAGPSAGAAGAGGAARPGDSQRWRRPQRRRGARRRGAGGRRAWRELLPAGRRRQRAAPPQAAGADAVEDFLSGQFLSHGRVGLRRSVVLREAAEREPPADTGAARQEQHAVAASGHGAAQAHLRGALAARVLQPQGAGLLRHAGGALRAGAGDLRRARAAARRRAHAASAGRVSQVRPWLSGGRAPRRRRGLRRRRVLGAAAQRHWEERAALRPERRARRAAGAARGALACRGGWARRAALGAAGRGRQAHPPGLPGGVRPRVGAERRGGRRRRRREGARLGGGRARHPGAGQAAARLALRRPAAAIVAAAHGRRLGRGVRRARARATLRGRRGRGRVGWHLECGRSAPKVGDGHSARGVGGAEKIPSHDVRSRHHAQRSGHSSG
ncbi:unnamed protein product [Prorocentrum cordatum]|uniref:Pumilio domain member 4 n=1 Tax=Prorocentrum cordatum TaxID=2364126 RepID=A0ABN9TJ38_9DINO|nr:unnamed protein product [Polarella glacialis]